MQTCLAKDATRWPDGSIFKFICDFTKTFCACENLTANSERHDDISLDLYKCVIIQRKTNKQRINWVLQILWGDLVNASGSPVSLPCATCSIVEESGRDVN